MALALLTNKDKSNIDEIMSFIEELPDENRRDIYYFALGTVSSNTCFSKKVEEKEDGRKE